MSKETISIRNLHYGFSNSVSYQKEYSRQTAKSMLFLAIAELCGTTLG